MRREFNAVFDSEQKMYVSIPALFVNQPLAEKYSKPFKVREVTPGEVTITREQLEDAIERHTNFINFSQDEFLNELFGGES